MTSWRKRAYSAFGLQPGSYSYSEGKKFLFRDMVDWAREALRDDDVRRIQDICDYVAWADCQHSDELDSVVALAFFKPVFDDEHLFLQLKEFLPAPLVAKMREILGPV